MSLDHLEEWLIAFLMGAATLLIFVAVVHRYAAGLADSRLAGRAAQDRPLVGAGALHLHVRVDGEVRRRVRRAHRHPRRRRRDDQPAAARHAQALRAVRPRSRAPCSRASSARWARPSSGTSRTPTRCRPTSKLPKWIVYLCIPLGSYLMCFRFLQVAWAFCRTGELPHHDVAHVEGIDDSQRLRVGRQPPSGAGQRRGKP